MSEPRKDSWIPLPDSRLIDGQQVLVCWGNCAIMVAYRSQHRWFAAVQTEDERGFSTIMQLSSAPTHFQPLPGAPEETWDCGSDHPAWGKM